MIVYAFSGLTSRCKTLIDAYYLVKKYPREIRKQ